MIKHLWPVTTNIGKHLALGLILMGELEWSENTESLIKNAKARTKNLERKKDCQAPIPDMIIALKTLIKSILEHSCGIWHSILSEETENIFF